MLAESQQQQQQQQASRSSSPAEPSSPAPAPAVKTKEDEINLEYLRNVILKFLENKPTRVSMCSRTVIDMSLIFLCNLGTIDPCINHDAKVQPWRDQAIASQSIEDSQLPTPLPIHIEYNFTHFTCSNTSHHAAFRLSLHGLVYIDYKDMRGEKEKVLMVNSWRRLLHAQEPHYAYASRLDMSYSWEHGL